MIHSFKYSEEVKSSLLFRAYRMLMCLELCRISVRSLGEKKSGSRKPHSSEAIKSFWQHMSYSQNRLLALCCAVSVSCAFGLQILLPSSYWHFTWFWTLSTISRLSWECKWTQNQQNYSMGWNAGGNEIVWGLQVWQNKTWRSHVTLCSFCPPKPCRILSVCYNPNIQELRRRQQVKDKVQAQHQNILVFIRVQECIKDWQVGGCSTYLFHVWFLKLGVFSKYLTSGSDK